ncbi:hypothetical protein, partial [Kaarinaea lacus]
MSKLLSIIRYSQYCHYFLLLIPLLMFYSSTTVADNGIPKLVYLIVDEDKVIASNIEFNRFDELTLNAKEEVINHEEGNAVA